MKITLLQLDNTIRGIEQRLDYIESLISKVTSTDLIVLPELSTASYIPNYHLWKYCGRQLKGVTICNLV